MTACSQTAGRPRRRWFVRVWLGCSWLALAVGGLWAGQPDELAKTFGTPDEAVMALAAAVKAQDALALRSLFGPAATGFTNPDRVQATNEFMTFAATLDQTHRLVRGAGGTYVLEVGPNHWPFPVPIAQQNQRWFFDAAAGTEEILNRRVGRNELETLQVVRAYVDAQREYATRDRDGDGVLEYAQKLSSSPGRADGLYWPPELNGEISPLGPLVAEAAGGGYNLPARAGTDERAPFHGYLFKILTRQGKQAPGGKYDYVINGNMIGGFALVAWPADYRNSGVMTFIVNQQGRVYQKDLGPKTGPMASTLKVYNPDPTWSVSPD